jgi:hypothetical protein
MEVFAAGDIHCGKSGCANAIGSANYDRCGECPCAILPHVGNGRLRIISLYEIDPDALVIEKDMSPRLGERPEGLISRRASVGVIATDWINPDVNEKGGGNADHRVRSFTMC